MKSDLLKGCLGIASTGGVVAVSWWTRLLPALQVISLSVGIVVGTLTAISLVITLKRKVK